MQVIASVGDSILQPPLVPREHPDAREAPGSVLPLICGYIRISGAREGALAMTCPRTLAARCSAIRYDQTAELLTVTEVREGRGELVNTVRGNLAALVPPVGHLGPPTMREQPIFGYEEERARVLNDVTFACQGHRLRLPVLQSGR